ncbi:hypothetical protein BDZ91DRAFT_848527 [Kalaharituber pfeilii]|nr:hypothetical protein BDZ91DRAFT_848527 [Kalaharituber pfeilii]
MFSLPYRQVFPSKGVGKLVRSAGPVRLLLPQGFRLYSSSSSKPSSPSDRPRNIAPAGTTRRKSGFGNSIEGTGISGAQNLYSRLPVVPNTDHLHPAEVAASSFFALHRPLSIKNSVPQAHTQSAFSSIFDSLDISNGPSTASNESDNNASKKANPAFSSYTPSQQPRTVERTIMGDLDSLISSIRDNWLTGTGRQNILATAIHNANANAQSQGDFGEESSGFDFSQRLFHPLTNMHVPFNPPPPPVPRMSIPSDNSRTQRQLITIQQTIYPNGMMMFTARSKIIAPVTSPYMQRLKERQREQLESWQNKVIEESQRAGLIGEEVSEKDQDVIMAISVKRQRKLKMKKHKYKKLMKRTRNLRRRLEKQ